MRSPGPSLQPPSTVPLPGARRVLGAFRQVSYRGGRGGRQDCADTTRSLCPGALHVPWGRCHPGSRSPAQSAAEALCSITRECERGFPGSGESHTQIQKQRLHPGIVSKCQQRLAARFVLETQPRWCPRLADRSCRGPGGPWTHCGLWTLFLIPGNSVILFFTSQHTS